MRVYNKGPFNKHKILIALASDILAMETSQRTSAYHTAWYHTMPYHAMPCQFGMFGISTLTIKICAWPPV